MEGLSEAEADEEEDEEEEEEAAEAGVEVREAVSMAPPALEKLEVAEARVSAAS